MGETGPILATALKHPGRRDMINKQRWLLPFTHTVNLPAEVASLLVSPPASLVLLRLPEPQDSPLKLHLRTAFLHLLHRHQSGRMTEGPSLLPRRCGSVSR